MTAALVTTLDLSPPPGARVWALARLLPPNPTAAESRLRPRAFGGHACRSVGLTLSTVAGIKRSFPSSSDGVVVQPFGQILCFALRTSTVAPVKFGSDTLKSASSNVTYLKLALLKLPAPRKCALLKLVTLLNSTSEKFASLLNQASSNTAPPAKVLEPKCTFPLK